MSGRTYKEAVEALNSLQSNAAVIASIRANWKDQAKFVAAETVEYWERLGYKTSDLNQLNVIHIAGTKGKGSTCAFASKLLTTLAPDAKVGLYTSPHLVAVRERIRINDVPISEELFAKYFWQVWDRFEANPQRKRGEETALRPAYFRYLTVMAFYVYLQEKVDAVVLEVGIGGLYDSTNIVPQPKVAAITTLGIDHVAILGKTLPEIALQKAGIYKENCPALTVDQPAEALAVLENKAEEVKASSFQVVQVTDSIKNTKLGLAGVHQRSNATLALRSVQTFLESPSIPDVFSAAQRTQRSNPGEWHRQISQSLAATLWAGRCQKLPDSTTPSLTWFLDGAHTTDSMTCCANWYADQVAPDPSAKRILVFNCTGDRTGEELLQALITAMVSHQVAPHPSTLFDTVIFCPNITYASGTTKSDLDNRTTVGGDATLLQRLLSATWQRLTNPDTPEGVSATRHPEAIVLDSIEGAADLIRDLATQSDRPINALVAGSLHLIGGLYEILGDSG